MQTTLVQELYEGCYRRLVAQLYAVTGDLAEAQDAVQEAFVRALTRSEQVSRLDNPEAWLRTVAVNVARSRWRRLRRLDRLLGVGSAPPPADLIAQLSPDRVALFTAMRELPPPQREALALYHLADLSVAEIARLTGVAEGTIKARLARGRTALALRLTDHPETNQHQEVSGA